ncbi:hypothetical protein DPMN_034398 [Dreissena polymorpha]|uniref:Uncharacterized protein n=1 Tax=Dreissena polymorpha TaxID=45954 RepID=A0A9D4M7H0_DREPO|nr:hypothetical protein DPMN_034398 [Dreissena polymorpha]
MVTKNFKLGTNIIETNLLTEFHEDRKINVASRVLTRKNATPPGSHVFQPTGIIFELIQDIIRMNLLTKFHEDRTVNVASRVLTRFYYSHFHDDRIINVTSRVLTKLKKITPPLWWPYIIGLNLLTEFHGDRTINVASRVKNAPPFGGHTNLLTIFHQDWTINVATRVKNATPPGGHVFQPTELVQDIIGMNLLTKFYKDWTRNVASRVKNAPPLGSHVFQAKFHEDRKINVASRVLTRKKCPATWRPYIIGINLLTKKNAPSLGSHVFQANVTIFELIQDIIETNLLTKFHEDWTINANVDVVQRTTHDGQKVITKAHHEHVLLG